MGASTVFTQNPPFRGFTQASENMMAQTDINMTPHKIGMWLLLNMILILHRLDLWHLMIRQVSSDNYYRFQDVAFCGSLIGLLLSTQIKTT